MNYSVASGKFFSYRFTLGTSSEVITQRK